MIYLEYSAHSMLVSTRVKSSFAIITTMAVSLSFGIWNVYFVYSFFIGDSTSTIFPIIILVGLFFVIASSFLWVIAFGIEVLHQEKNKQPTETLTQEQEPEA
jgi:hypothetical protein